jgi:hypothetical protein
MQTLFNSMWIANRCYSCRRFSIVPMYVPFSKTEPYFGLSTLLTSPDPAASRCEKIRSNGNNLMLMFKTACSARQQRLESVKLMFPVRDEEEVKDDSQVDVAFIHTFGWCDWWYIQASGWRHAQGLPQDGRGLWFYPVNADKKERAGTFDSIKWMTEAPFGKSYPSGETKFGPLCGILGGMLLTYPSHLPARPSHSPTTQQQVDG